MFTVNPKCVVVLDWKDPFGNQRFRFGPGEKDVIWLTGPDRIKEKLPLHTKGVLTKVNDRWFFERYQA